MFTKTLFRLNLDWSPKQVVAESAGRGTEFSIINKNAVSKGADLLTTKGTKEAGTITLQKDTKHF